MKTTFSQTFRPETVFTTFMTALWLASAAFLASCSQKAEVWINEKEGGRFEAQVEIDAALAAYWKDLEELDPALKEGILNPVSVAKALKGLKSLTNVTAVAPAPRLLKVSVEFASAEKIWENYKSEGSKPLFRFFAKGGDRGMTLYLDKKNLRQILTMTSLGQAEALKPLFPQEANPLTRAEYKELLTYFLEPYSTDPGLLIDQAGIELIVHLPRAIKSAPGGKAEGGQVSYRLPLLTVLSLEKPMEFEIVY